MTVKPDTLYWLFSTIAQTWGAILGVGGLLVVFKLERLRDARWSIIKDISIVSEVFLGDSKISARKILDVFRVAIGRTAGAVSLPTGEVINYDRTRLGSKKESLGQGGDSETTMLSFPDFGIRLMELEDVLLQEGRIKNKFFQLLLASLLTIVISVGALMFCENLSKDPWWGTWGPAVLLVGVFVVLSIVEMFKLCLTIIQREKE